MPHDTSEMAKTVVALGQYFGMSILPSPHLPHGHWVFGAGNTIVVAHDLWDMLGIPVFDAEMILPDEEICQTYEHFPS